MPKAPAYLLHKPSGRARVRIDGKDHYLGPHGSPESLERYNDLIAEWRIRNVTGDRYVLTIDDLALSYLEHCKQHYVKDGRQTSEVWCMRSALKYVVAEAGPDRARDFGPKRLKAVRQRMITAGLARRTINTGVERIRRMFRWAVGEELLPAPVLTALEAVEGLRAGRSGAKEPKAVSPVSRAAVEAVRPHVPAMVWAAIDLQWHSGMRSGEVLAMRACDLNMSGEVWEYRPESHKTEHHGKGRLIFLGPQAQAIVRECLAADTQARLFRYNRDSYRRAIMRACQRAHGMPHELRDVRCGLDKLPVSQRAKVRQERQKAAAEWREQHCWFPHQLRHSAATRIRREAGIEVAKAVLGHSDLDVTALYAEADETRARDIMLKVG